MRTVNALVVRFTLWVGLLACLLFASILMESAWPLWITLALVILATELIQTFVRRGRAFTRTASASSAALGRAVFGRVAGGHVQEDVVPAELPPPPGVLEGRDEEVGQICRYLASPVSRSARPLVVISGKPGVGKSALAVTVAHLVADHYPDGQLLVRFDTDSENKVEGALAMFMRALQRRADPAPTEKEAVSERVRWYQERTRNRRVLIILDNISDLDAIRQLVPGGPRCALIVTSRTAVPEAELPDHLPVSLDPLDPTWSTRLLAAMVGEERIRSDSRHAERVIQATAGYLVGIQIVAAALAARRRWSLVAAVERAEQVAGERGEVKVDEVPFVGALDLAYALLTDQERIALILLALLKTRRVEPWELAGLYRGAHPDTRMTTEIAGRLLDRLATARFTERRVDDGSGVLAFRVPVYVQAYALAQADVRLTADQRSAARRLRDEHGRERARRGNRQPLRTVYRSLEQGELSAALEAARQAMALARTPEVDPRGAAVDEALALAALAEVYAELGWVEDGMMHAEEALNLTGESVTLRARALRVLASLQRRHRLVSEADGNLVEACRLIERVDDAPERIRVLYELAFTYALSPDPGSGLPVAEKALELCNQTGDSGIRRRPAVLLAYGSVLAACKRRDQAEATLRDAELAIGQEGGPQLWRPWIRLQRAAVALNREDPERSRELGVSALEGFTQLRHRYGMAHARLAIGRSHLAEGDVVRAVQRLEEAHSTFGTCGDRWAEADAALTLAEAYLQQAEAQRAATLASAAEQALAKLGDVDGQRRAGNLLWAIEWSLPPEPQRREPAAEATSAGRRRITRPGS